MWRYFFIILVLLAVRKSPGFSLAELSYNLINEKCPARATTTEDCNCTIHLSSPVSEKSTGADFAFKLTDETYFAALAEVRAQALSCSSAQIQSLEKDPDSLDWFAQWYIRKLAQVAREKRLMESLTAAIPGSADAKLKYSQARARAESLLSVLPYSQTSAMSKYIAFIASQGDILKSDDIDKDLMKMFVQTFKSSLVKAKSEIDQNVAVLNKGISSSGNFKRDVKESLAKDRDLVESFRQKQTVPENVLKPIACRADAEFGRGAEYRENTLLAVSILGTGAAGAVSKLAVSRALSSSITGASAMGNISARTAGLLRIVGGAANGSLIVESIFRNCFPGATLRENSQGRCETNPIQSLGNDECGLHLAMTALGGQMVFKSVALGTAEVRYGASAWDAQTSSGLRAQAYALEKRGAESSSLKMNQTILKEFRERAPTAATINKPIATAASADVSDLPPKMRERIVALKQNLNQVEFSAPKFGKNKRTGTSLLGDRAERYLPGDAKLSEALVDAFGDLHDKQKFASYAEKLIADTTRKMISSGDAALKTKAQAGILDQNSMIEVINSRMTARGLEFSNIPENAGVLSKKVFQEYIREGPIVDVALGAGSKLENLHGVYPHVLQLDYVLPTIEKSMGRKGLPLVFEYFGTNRGFKFWNESFDLLDKESKAFTNTSFLKQHVMGKDQLNLP